MTLLKVETRLPYQKVSKHSTGIRKSKMSCLTIGNSKTNGRLREPTFGIYSRISLGSLGKQTGSYSWIRLSATAYSWCWVYYIDCGGADIKLCYRHDLTYQPTDTPLDVIRRQRKLRTAFELRQRFHYNNQASHNAICSKIQHMTDKAHATSKRCTC